MTSMGGEKCGFLLHLLVLVVGIWYTQTFFISQFGNNSVQTTNGSSTTTITTDNKNRRVVVNDHHELSSHIIGNPNSENLKPMRNLNTNGIEKNTTTSQADTCANTDKYENTTNATTQMFFVVQVSFRWLLILPTIIISWIFSFPFIYGMVNLLYAAPKSFTSLNIIQDHYQLYVQRYQDDDNTKHNEMNHVPHTTGSNYECNGDNSVKNKDQVERSCKIVQNRIGKNKHDTMGVVEQQAKNNNNRSIIKVPEIVDMDVGVINDMILQNYRMLSYNSKE